jgi:hypothetical protein
MPQVPVTPKLEPGLNHIGLNFETVARLKRHPQGKNLRVLRHDHYSPHYRDTTGGYVLSVTNEQYAHLAQLTEQYHCTMHDAVRLAFAEGVLAPGDLFP